MNNNKLPSNPIYLNSITPNILPPTNLNIEKNKNSFSKPIQTQLSSSIISQPQAPNPKTPNFHPCQTHNNPKSNNGKVFL